MPTLLQIIKDYFLTAISYWWVLVPGVLMPLRDVSKLIRGSSRDKPTPRWVELTVIVICLSVAQFLAYRNQTLNLAQVIEEKRQFSTTINALSGSLAKEKEKNAALPKAFQEPSDSLRRRTFKLADEYTGFFIKSQENKPPDAFPNSAEPNPSEERKKAMQVYQSYWRKVEDEYAARFRARFIGIVREYQSKGVRVGFLENDFAQRLPMIPQPGSAWEGMDEISRFRELAYHVDARDHLIVLGF